MRIVAIVGTLERTRNGNMTADELPLLPVDVEARGAFDDDAPAATDRGAAVSLELVVRRWVAVLSAMVQVGESSVFGF